jgi:hypothetical protein
VLKAAPLARLGYHQYTYISHVFDMVMPFMPDDDVSGNILGGVAPASDVILYATKDKRSEEERRLAERAYNAEHPRVTKAVEDGSHTRLEGH